MEWLNIPVDSEVRGMTGNTILYADRTFTDENVLPSGNMPRERSLLSDVLAIDSFSFDVISEDTTLVNFIRNTPLTYYHNDVQMGIFYVQKISRTSINTYRFDCTSTVGLLDESYHNGGIYTGQTVDEVVTDICSPYLVIVKNNIKSIKLYGWLPIATKRENLTQVLFAIGATLKVDYNGVIRIEGLWDSQSAEIDADHMYSGGSVEYATPVTQVIVTEHAYNQTATETVDLFEGTASAGDKITFDEPCYDLAADGFSITESGANYAIVTSGSGKLTGKKYVHTTRQVIKDIAPQTRDLIDQSDSVVKVESATLVSLANSNAVAERLVSYYSCNERIVSDVLTQSESPGDVVSIVHPYGGTVEGCIESSDITMSKKLKSNESVLVGYKPPDIGEQEYYDSVEIITQDQQWQTPEGVTQIRPVLIGGGDGGGLGNPGATGTNNWGASNPSTAGGDPGTPGNGGKIYTIDIAVTPGQTFDIHIGPGGMGQTTSAPAEAGGNTTFGQYSSANGSSSPEGYTDIIHGVTYGAVGDTGIAGGHGQGDQNEGTNVVHNGVTYTPGRQGESFERDFRPESYRFAGGGYGGGPAAGANGGDGKDGSFSGTNYFADGGDGGDGATPVKALNATIPGKGGTSGHGGGGGGQGGYAEASRDDSKQFGASGNPGAGGEGGNGAPGCVLIYYRIYKENRVKRFCGKGMVGFNDKYKRMVVA